MISLRPANQRGRTKLDWLESWHSFSFGDYFDPAHMSFGPLRVINDDRVAPGAGFPPHPHREMEIITYLVSGALEHRDSLGNGSVIRRGELQRMSAGTGIRHSEFNGSKAEPVHLLQIWITPEQPGLPPGYEQRAFADDNKRGRLKLIGSRDGREGSVTIHQDVNLYACVLDAGERVGHPLRKDRSAWLQVVSGTLDLNGRPLAVGDGAAVSDEAALALSAQSPSEFLLFDLG